MWTLDRPHPSASHTMRPLHIRLQQAAAAKGWRAADVARLMPEVNASTVGHWFAGRRQPQMDHLRKLAKILEVSAAALVADEPDYAHTAEEKLGLLMMRDMTPEQRQAFLALGTTIAPRRAP